MLPRMQIGLVHMHCKSVVSINLYVLTIPDGQISVFERDYLHIVDMRES